MISGIVEIDQITFDQIERCVDILNLHLDHDKLFEEMITLQSTFKEIVSFRESLFVQIQRYVGDDGCDSDEIEEREEEEEQFFHKTTTSKHTDHHHRIRSDQLWAYLISRTATKCPELTKLVAFVYSIPCTNAFAEGVFSHMKHAWTPSRNSMSIKTIAAELQIRLNCQMKCDDFFSFVKNEPDLIKCARRTEKYNCKKSSI